MEVQQAFERQARQARQEQERRRTAWEIFRRYGGADQERFRAAYIGAWPDRAAFGSHLLDEYGASERLAELPRWLRPYVQLDTAKIVTEFEAAGHYIVAEVSDQIYVFDARA